MVWCSSKKLAIDSAFRVPKCDKLTGAFQTLCSSKLEFTELDR